MSLHSLGQRQTLGMAEGNDRYGSLADILPWAAVCPLLGAKQTSVGPVGHVRE